VVAYADPKLQKVQFEKLPAELKSYYIKIIDYAKEARKLNWNLRFVDLKDDETREKMALNIIDLKDKEARLWNKIDHYLTHGEIVPTVESSVDITKMSDLELKRFEGNRKASESHHKKQRAKYENDLAKCRDQKKRQYISAKLQRSTELREMHYAELIAARAELKRRENNEKS